MDEPYSKREQDYFFQEVFKRMDKQDSYLDRIEKQTLKTNGRVNKLEWWRSAILWAFGVFLALLVPLVNFVQAQIRQTVVGVLSEYDIVVKK